MTTASDVRDQINAAFKKDVLKLGNDPDLEVSYWSTGILAVDYLLNGGLPTGRIVELYGDYSTLKSYIGLCSLGAVQKAGGKVALVDTEHAWDAEWGIELGIDPSGLLVQQPDTAEEAVMLMETLVRGGYDLILWDSIAASQPKQYAEAKPGEDNAPAGLARVMSRGLNRLNTVNKKTCILALNQTRVNVGVTFGSANTTPGGKAMPFYASYRVRLIKAGKITEPAKVFDGEKMVDGKKTTAIKIKAELEKSKLTRPFAETWFLYDLSMSAVDDTMFLIGQGMERGLVAQSGAFYSVPEVSDQKLQGMANFKNFMQENPEVIEWLKTEIMPTSRLASPGSPPTPAKSKGGKRK